MANKKPALLRTPRDVIRALGGAISCTKLTGVTVAAVYNWIYEGHIPPQWYLLFTNELRERGYVADPAVFRQVQRAS